MIRLEHFGKTYGLRSGAVPAVHEVSFTAPRGEITGLLGQNGAGKTTILKAVCAIHYPTEGKVWAEHFLTAEHPVEVRKITGYVSEQPALYSGFTAREFLSHIAAIRLSALGIPKAEHKARVEQVIDLCAIEGDMLHKQTGALSKGYRQRLALAQALVHDPKILVLDEPTSGLDPVQIHQMRLLITALAKNKTVLLSTHLMQEAEALCATIHIIHQGTLTLSGTKAEILQKTGTSTLEEGFLRAVGEP
ncbi:MAG: ABC transporter ATP-binding protein [Treponema sp.]|jgi:ABC-2 type transport system ATP-binding protein|nr:ABC transporter ATP-binding protein [Treponema sp.]